LVALDVDGAVDDLAVGHGVTGALGELAEAGAAKVEPRETEVVEGVGGGDEVPGAAAAGESPEAAEEAGGQGGMGAVPPVEPDVADEALGDPVVGDVEDGGDAEALEGEGEGFGEAAEVPDVDEVGLEVADGGEQGVVVVAFELAEVLDAEPGVAEEAVEAELAADGEGGGLALGEVGELVVGGEDFEGMAAVVEGLGDVAAAEFVTADVVGRVEVGEDEDTHERGDLAEG
jgi:hypothetical protein